MRVDERFAEKQPLHRVPERARFQAALGFFRVCHGLSMHARPAWHALCGEINPILKCVKKWVLLLRQECIKTSLASVRISSRRWLSAGCRVDR
ncbi:hypothetical protein GCM10009565_01440 [Amycolatopsis albidoflavus]